MKNIKILLLILLVAFFLRIVNISDNPSAMYGDELTMLLDVNSILHTGYDTTGKFLPLNFSMGGGRPVGYGYFSIPLIAIFGPSALGIRMLSVLAGVGIVFLIYLLSKKLFSNQVGLFAAAVMAVSPWDLSMSRGGFESHFALFLSLLMITVLLHASNKAYLYVVSAFTFGLTINTYSTYKLVLPIFLPLLLWFSAIKERFFTSKRRMYLILSGAVLFLFMLLLLFQGSLNNSESRFLSINIFAKKAVKDQIMQSIAEQRSISPISQEITKLLNNSYIEYGFLLGRSYLNNFSMDFLFLTGDKNPRQNMATSGCLYIVEIITIMFGIGYLIRRGNFRKGAFLIGWILLAPVATTLLLEPHALRSSFMLPPLILLSALGVSFLWELRRNKTIFFLFFVIIIGYVIQFLFIAENLYFISPNKYSRFWAYPAKKATEIANENRNKYDYIFLSDRVDAIEFAYPVYNTIDPLEVSEASKHEVRIGEYNFKRYGNIYLGPIPDSAAEKFLGNLKGRILYIGPANDTKYLLGGYDVVKGKDNKDALVIKIKQQ